jgi:hypothetical protein
VRSSRGGGPKAEARLLIFYLLGIFVVSQGFGDVATPWPVVDQIALLVKGLIFVPSLYSWRYMRPATQRPFQARGAVT